MVGKGYTQNVKTKFREKAKKSNRLRSKPENAKDQAKVPEELSRISIAVSRNAGLQGK